MLRTRDTPERLRQMYRHIITLRVVSSGENRDMTSSHSALIVIDMQRSFSALPEWGQVSNPDIVTNVARLVATAREKGHQVVWVLHASPNSNDEFDPAHGLVRPLDGLNPAEGEHIVTKTSRNAFTTTNLAQHLTRAGITDLVICGIQTEQCCETTARVAADLGYHVTFVTEATATFPIRWPDTGAVLGTDAIIERTEFALAGRFARISTIDSAFDTPAKA